VPEDASAAAVPMVNVKPVKISAIEAAEVNSFIDVIAVLDSCMDMGVITRRDGSETQKRSFTIRDDSSKSVEVTLWGEKATGIGTELFDRFRAGQHPVVIVKGKR
jgi:replication factor A1